MEKQIELLNRVAEYIIDLGLRCPPYTMRGLFHNITVDLEYYEGIESIQFIVINNEIVVRKV